MPNFLMTVHKEHCAICWLYAKHVVDVSKGATILILHPWIASMFCSAWSQSMTTIEDQATLEVDHKCNWYCNHCDDWARRTKIAEGKISFKKDQCHKAEVNLEASMVGKKTVPMFVHFGKIGLVRNNDII